MLDGGDMGLMVCGKMISTAEAGFAISVTSRLLFHSFTHAPKAKVGQF